MSIVKPWQTLASCFVVDFEQPDFVRLSAPIFDLTEKDVTMTPHGEAELKITSVSSGEDASDEFSAAVKLSASYGCFSGSASMGVDTSSSMSKKTMRTDVKVTSAKYAVSGNAPFLVEPETFVTAYLQKYIAEGAMTMEQLETVVGHFYCSKCRLGGVFKRSYIVEKSAKDTKLSMQASLTATYGAGLTSASAEASVGIKTAAHNKNASMRIEQRCLGGDPGIWLGATADNTNEIQAKWAASVTDDNLFALDLKLNFSWTLVEKLNPTLGAQYKKHLQEKWAKQGDSGNPADYAEVHPRLDPGPIDGKFGPMTIKALQQFLLSEQQALIRELAGTVGKNAAVGALMMVQDLMMTNPEVVKGEFGEGTVTLLQTYLSRA